MRSNVLYGCFNVLVVTMFILVVTATSSLEYDNDLMVDGDYPGLWASAPVKTSNHLQATKELDHQLDDLDIAEERTKQLFQTELARKQQVRH